MKTKTKTDGAPAAGEADADSVVSVSVVAAIEAASPDTTILLHGGVTLQAHSQLLRLACTCAAGAPHPLTTWDLQHLQLGGRDAPSKEVVGLWLEAVYKDLLVFNPAMGVGSSMSASLLCALLAFADAVGTSSSLMQRILPGGGSNAVLHVDVSLEGVGDMKLSLSGQHEYFFCNAAIICLDTVSGTQTHFPEAPMDSSAVQLVGATVAGCIQQLLLVSGRLQLHNLRVVVARFLKRHSVAGLPMILQNRFFGYGTSYKASLCQSLLSPAAEKQLYISTVSSLDHQTLKLAVMSLLEKQNADVINAVIFH
jgi:hypothetical protein